MLQVRTSGVLSALVLLAVPLAAQMPVITTPRESPSATVSQVVGMTRVTVEYARPSVNGRKIWGGLVPYDAVWRAGANENTVLSVSSPFTVGGMKLPAGRYGLHTIPTTGAWTVMVSREANAWGSFSYNPAEDAVRFSVTPTAAEHEEMLRYTLDPTSDSTVAVTLRWEKLALRFPLTVPTTQVVLDSVANQLRGIGYFFPQAWNQAAMQAIARGQWALAASWADSAITRNGGFQSLRIKALALEKHGNTAEAARLRDQALAVATEAEVNTLGYQMMNAGKMDEALTLFRKNVADYPRSWNVYDSLAEALAKKGDKRGALQNYQRALDMAPDETQKARIRAAMTALR